MYSASYISCACAMLYWRKQLHRIENTQMRRLEEITIDRRIFFSFKKRREKDKTKLMENESERKRISETCEHGHQEKA